MEGEIFVLTIVAIGCLTGIITSWINRNKNAGYDEQTFERLAKAFMKFKKNAERRIQNLEAIIADETNSATKKVEEPKSTIEIEDKKDQKSESGNSSLSNMLPRINNGETMSGEEFVLAIVGLVMGCAVLIVGITKITGLIQSWINRNNSSLDDETFERLAKAFVQHKKDSERRIQNLEAIISDQDHISPKKIEESKGTIEIVNKKERESESGDGNLSNMLRE